MGYIDDNLLPGESVVFRTKLHWVVFLPAGILLVLALLLMAGGEGGRVFAVFALSIAVVYGVDALIKYATSEFGVTNRRVIAKAGWIRRRSLETLLQKVEGIGVDQGMWGRLLGYGTVVITGTGGSKEPFRRVARPLELRRHVHEQVGGKP